MNTILTPPELAASFINHPSFFELKLKCLERIKNYTPGGPSEGYGMFIGAFKVFSYLEDIANEIKKDDDSISEKFYDEEDLDLKEEVLPGEENYIL